MKVISLSVKNFRSLKDVTLTQLGNLVVIIGPNSSGKTNIVEALKFFFGGFGLGGSGNNEAIPDYVWFNREVGETVTFRVILQVLDNEFKYGPRYAVFKPGVGEETAEGRKSLEKIKLFLETEPVNIVEVTRCLRAVGSETSWSTDRLLVNGKVIINDAKVVAGEEACRQFFSDLEGKSVFQPLERVLAMIDLTLAKTLAYAFRSASAAGSPRELLNAPGVRESFLEKDVHNELVSLFQSTERAKQKRWEFIERMFRQIEPGIADIRSLGGKITTGEKGSGFRPPISLIGGGLQEALSLLLVLSEDNMVISIEEPEMHMHPRLARRFFAILKENSARNQIFLTTHSTVFVDSADLRDTWVVKKKGLESTDTKVIDPNHLKPILRDLGIRPSDIFFPNGLIFVEGRTEFIFIRAMASLLGMDLESYGISVIPVCGKSRGAHHLRVWCDVASTTNVPFSMILDADAEKEAEEMVSKGLINEENLFRLEKGTIEDYYDKRRLSEALRSLYQLREGEWQTLLDIPRAKHIEDFLKQTRRYTESWKVDLAERIAETSSSPNEVDKGLVTILHKIVKALAQSVLE